jgi:fructose-specific phosphotransferase system component IIB
MLERRQRREYGPEVKVEHAGSIGKASELTDEELANIAAGGGEGDSGS